MTTSRSEVPVAPSRLKLGLVFVGLALATGFLLTLLATLFVPDPSRLGVTILTVSVSLPAAVVAIRSGLSGNRAVRELSDAERSRVLAAVPPGTARLIVLREGFVGKAQGVDVRVNDVFAVQLKSPRVAAMDLSPGDHAVEATVANGKPDRASLVLAAGETRVFRIVVGMGRVRLQPEADDPARRARIATMRMVASEGIDGERTA